MAYWIPLLPTEFHSEEFQLTDILWINPFNYLVPGVLTLLKIPYPRDIEEPEEYETVHVHAEWGKQKTDAQNNNVPGSVSL